MSGSVPLVEQTDVEKVAEIAVEPCWISEAARKLVRSDPVWESFNHTYAVQLVSRVAYLLHQEGRIQVDRPDYADFGGQKESSPKLTLADDSQETREEWYEYTLIHNTNTEYENVRQNYRDVVDPSVTMDDKREIADFLSRMGNQTAQVAEEILSDQLNAIMADYEVLEKTDYNHPDPDMYVQGIELESGESHEHGLAIEISTRWVNPLGSPYISKKANQVIGLEKEHGVAVDLLILAPRYTQSMVQKYLSSDIVQLRRLPTVGDGSPVIIPDPIDERRTNVGLPDTGPRYPLVTDDKTVLVNDMANVFRDYNAMGEYEYRQEIGDILQQELS